MLAFVGDGPDRLAVQQHAVELGIADHVLFLGQRSDVNRLYQASMYSASPAFMRVWGW